MEEDFPSPPFGSEKSCICLRPGTPDPFGRLGRLQPGLQRNSDPLQPGCEEPCNCVKPAKKDPFDRVRPALQRPCSCHLPSGGHPAPPPDLRGPSARPQTGKFPWKTALVISLLVAVLLGCIIPRKERSEMKGDLEEMMDDAKEAVGEFLDLTTGFLKSVASAVKQTAPGETTATRTYTETDENDEEDEEDEEDHKKEALTLDGLKKKGKKLVRLGKEVLDGSYEERIEPSSHKHQETDKRRSKGRKTAETVVSKDQDGQGFSAQRTTHTEKVYEMPEYMKKFYDDNDDKQRLGHKEDL